MTSVDHELSIKYFTYALTVSPGLWVAGKKLLMIIYVNSPSSGRYWTSGAVALYLCLVAAVDRGPLDKLTEEDPEGGRPLCRVRGPVGQLDPAPGHGGLPDPGEPGRVQTRPQDDDGEQACHHHTSLKNTLKILFYYYKYYFFVKMFIHRRVGGGEGPVRLCWRKSAKL